MAGHLAPMCGRARLSSDVSEIKLVFSIPPERPTPNIPANWNAAPTEDLPWSGMIPGRASGAST